MCLLGTFTNPKAMYWVGLVSLFVQSLVWVFMFPAVVQLTKDRQIDEWTNGQALALFCASIPFAIPLVVAWMTAAVSGNPMLGVAAFTFYSLVQVIAHGIQSEQEKLTNHMITAVKFALPILAFLISVMRALH